MPGMFCNHAPMPTPTAPQDFTLDPSDWVQFRAQAMRAMENALDHMQAANEGPVWQPMPGETKERLRSPLPEHGQDLKEVLDQVQSDIFPYPYGNSHPRFWGWVNGSALPVGILGDLLASTLNPNVGAFQHAGTAVEEQVLDWLRSMLAFPSGDGLLTSGGSMANLIGLNAAVVAKAGFDLRAEGLQAGPQLVIYQSSQTHNSIEKSVEMLGIGRAHLRSIGVDQALQFDLNELKNTIQADRAAGLHPVAVVGTLGTVGPGSNDPIDALADLCEEEKLWLHVDGAFGALAWLVPECRPALKGMQRADSLAFDLHKWLYLSSDVGCLLVRDPEGLKRAFAAQASYLTPLGGGPAANMEGAFKDRGLELTRRFRALKVWMALKHHGRTGFENMIRTNLEQAQFLTQLIQAEDQLELLAPTALNVVCFRFTIKGVEQAALNELNRRILVELQVSGTAMPSNTLIDGKFALRCAITNHRSRAEDYRILVEACLRIGKRFM